MRIVTANEMKQIEKSAAEHGLSYYQMMENAGTAAAEILKKRLTPNGKKILVIAGQGNNGGDGFVAARLFCRDGAKVRIYLAGGEPKTEDARKNFMLCQALPIPIYDKDSANAEALCADADCVIDALYGTGFHGSLSEEAAALTQAINQSGAFVCALDIPSGVAADTGEADKNAVRADLTIAFDSLKHAHVLPQAQPFCGTVQRADIGILEEWHPQKGNNAEC